MGISWVVTVASFFFFLFFQAKGIYTGDSGDLVTAAALMGVPHPPGYPLYTFVGFLVSKLPLFTVSWRITLLSSLPHAITIGLVYALVVRLTKNKLSGIFASLVLIGNYLFFLYSVTPEVFALLDMFFIILFTLIFVWYETKNNRYFLWAGFVFGLSLTHHHVILFWVPAALFLVTRAVKSGRIATPPLRHCLRYFLLGLLPYAYAPIAGLGDQVINWDRPVNIPGFIRLITRADYGSFISGPMFGTSISERFVSLVTVFRFLPLDFTVVGLVLVVAGLWFLWRTHREVSMYWLLAVVFMGPVFLMYASFPLASAFTLGTYERFLLPVYVLVSLLIGVGLFQVQLWVRRVGNRVFKKKIPVLSMGVSVVLFLYPLSLGYITVYRMIGIRDDMTAENLAGDILGTLPDRAVVLLGRDTVLFTTQYLRYAVGVRPDTIVLHASALPSSDYRTVLKKRFPELLIPEDGSTNPILEFIRSNAPGNRIFSNVVLSNPEGTYWVPHGLLMELTRNESLPLVDTLMETNEKIWASYHDPYAGILAKFRHLMLADVLDVYAGGHITYGDTLFRARRYAQAASEYQAAIDLKADALLPQAWTRLGQARVLSSDCQGGVEAFATARASSYVAMPELLFYEATTYRDCVGDAQRAQQLFAEYEVLKKQTELRLDQL